MWIDLKHNYPKCYALESVIATIVSAYISKVKNEITEKKKNIYMAHITVVTIFGETAPKI